MFLAKSEEWQMFELDSEHPATRSWEEARQLFTQALNIENPVDADRAGRESLVAAVDATERLAMAHAEILLHRRYLSRAASSTSLGIRVTPSISPSRYGEIIAREFDLIFLPLRWRDLEPEEGRYEWGPLDQWMNWAKAHGKPVIAGPLIDFSASAVPDWLYVWQHDYETTRDLVYDHMDRLAQRYSGAVAVWSLANGLNVNENFRFTPAQMIDLARMANLLVRERNRRARTMLEIVQPFGEHVARHRDSVPPFVYIDRVIQEGIRVDCFGVQLVMGAAAPGLAARDLMHLSSLLDRFFLLELPVLVTRIGVPSAAQGDAAGYWHAPWSPQVQANWVGKAFGMVLSKPHVDSFLWAELQDSPGGDLPDFGLIDAAGEPKPALKRLTDMRRRLRKPLGPMRLPTQAAL
jgi:GH35 family endo-1,4-beta-xylanase